MMHPLRHIRFVLAIAAGACIAANTAIADDYPTRPIRLVVATAAGGLVDVATRKFNLP